MLNYSYFWTVSLDYAKLTASHLHSKHRDMSVVSIFSVNSRQDGKWAYFIYGFISFSSFQTECF